MFSFRRETDYAIQLLKFLSLSKKDYTSLHEVSTATGISFHFLQKIARKLRMARLIKGGKGVDGGYCLNIRPEKINLKIIAEAMEDKSVILPCYNKIKPSRCINAGSRCVLKNKLRKINSQMIKILQNVKLNEL